MAVIFKKSKIFPADEGLASTPSCAKDLVAPVCSARSLNETFFEQRNYLTLFSILPISEILVALLSEGKGETMHNSNQAG